MPFIWKNDGSKVKLPKKGTKPSLPQAEETLLEVPGHEPVVEPKESPEEKPAKPSRRKKEVSE
jgi:hypothetical protein